MKANQEIDDQLAKLRKALSHAEKQELRSHLVFYLNHLMIEDFGALVQILYRVDVSEQRLKQMLQENAGTDAAEIIADLLMERQEQKMKSRADFKQENDIPEDEKW